MGGPANAADRLDVEAELVSKTLVRDWKFVWNVTPRRVLAYHCINAPHGRTLRFEAFIDDDDGCVDLKPHTMNGMAHSITYHGTSSRKTEHENAHCGEPAYIMLIQDDITHTQPKGHRPLDHCC